MEVIEEIKSNEWFHLIDHMYAKWPKINLPFLANVDETITSAHRIPDVVRNTAIGQKNMKRKKGRKRKGMQKPTKKRGVTKVQTRKTADSRKKEMMEKTAGRMSSAASSVQRRISIIQTRAQKGSGGNVRVGLHFRQCPCCEGGSGFQKPRLLAKVQEKQDEEKKA